MITAIKQEGEQAPVSVVKSEISAMRLLRVGDLVEGKVLEKGSRMILVDLGLYGTGAVYRGEMQNAREIVRALNVDDPVRGKVVDVDNEDGFVELSLSHADRQKSWENVQDIKDKEEVLKVKITGFNKGGLITDIHGLPAFLPISQLINPSENKGEIGVNGSHTDLEKLVGGEVEIRITDVNPRTNKLIISEKAAKEESPREMVRNYSVGQIVEGVVTGIADFGVFVKFTDNPSVEGLIHISELGYKIVENPKEMVKIDDLVKVKITDIKDGKISLSLKALMSDPWSGIEGRYKNGQEVSGKGRGVQPFGAVIDLDDEIQGQVHVASFGGVEEMKKKLSQGEVYTFEIESLNAAEH